MTQPHHDPWTSALVLGIALWPAVLTIVIAALGCWWMLRRPGGRNLTRVMAAIAWCAAVALTGYVATGEWLGEVGIYAVDYVRFCGREKGWRLMQGLVAERTTDVRGYVARHFPEDYYHGCVDWASE